MAERIDDLQYKGLRLVQDTDGFCFGVDAVLLAHLAKGAPSKRTIDLCSGNGIVAILLAGKTDTPDITALEIQHGAAELAQRSVSLNHLEGRVRVVCGDLKDAGKLFARGSFDVVTCNPPYMKDACGLKNENEAMRIARHEVLCTLEDVVRAAAYLLKPGGKFFLVHRPERLVDIFTTMREYKIEPKRMQMVHPSCGKKANIVLIEGASRGGRELKMLPPLYVYGENGCYSKEIDEIYERGCGL